MPSGVKRPRSAALTILQDRGPNAVTITRHHGMGLAAAARFLDKQGGVNAAVYDPGSAWAGGAAQLITAHCITCVEADAHHIAREDDRRIPRLQRFRRASKYPLLPGAERQPGRTSSVGS